MPGMSPRAFNQLPNFEYQTRIHTVWRFRWVENEARSPEVRSSRSWWQLGLDGVAVLRIEKCCGSGRGRRPWRLNDGFLWFEHLVPLGCCHPVLIPLSASQWISVEKGVEKATSLKVW